jgi:hypothetical protein
MSPTDWLPETTRITRSELQAGDLIVSRKKGSNLFQKLFNSLIEDVGERKYGKTGLFLRSNHVRVCLGQGVQGGPLLFHWTWPKSELVDYEPWMILPSYAVVCRPKQTPSFLWEYVVTNLTRWYNIGLLLDIYLGLSFEFFSLGLDNEVCSTGAMEMVAPPPHRRAIPADFLNFPSFFEIVSFDTAVTELCEEPELEKI